MKKYILYLLVIPFFFCCSKDDNRRNTNPFLPDYSFSVQIDLNLPLYSNLNSPINPQIVHLETGGIKGLIVMKVSNTDYKVWEAACPNQYTTQDCSLMTLNGVNAKCPCDDIEYSLFTGVGNGGSYALKAYRVEIQGKLLRVYN